MSSIAPILFAERMERGGSPIGEFMRQGVRQPELISLAAGLVDQESLPVEEVIATAHDLLRESKLARELLQYGQTEGYGPLREMLARNLTTVDRLEDVGGSLTADDLIVGSGSQQLLYILGETLIAEGDIVLVASPGYFVYMGAMESLGARLVGVEADQDGIVPSSLDQRLHEIDRAGELGRVRFVYEVTYFNNPTGSTLSAQRRPMVMEVIQRWSRGHRLLYVEDAAYRELRYHGEDVPSLLKYDPLRQWVVYAGTFSKPFAPGVRTGYVVAPREVLHAMGRIKGLHDFGSANLNQGIAYGVLASGLYDKHLATLRRVYGEKLACVLDILDKELGSLGGQVDWTRPEGGLYVWVRLPANVSTEFDRPFFLDCLKENVLYVPGNLCYPNGATSPVAGSGEVAATNCLRLSYSHVCLTRCEEGVRRLCRVIRRHIEPKGSSGVKA